MTLAVALASLTLTYAVVHGTAALVFGWFERGAQERSWR